MAETLGSLCDKLTIVKLKQWHSKDHKRRKSLAQQNLLLQQEINQYITDAVAGRIEKHRLTFAANKVYKKHGNAVAMVMGDLGAIISQLAQTNCALWHEQEKVYEFDLVPDAEKGAVVKKLALLNLERNHCMEAIDRQLLKHVEPKTSRGK